MKCILVGGFKKEYISFVLSFSINGVVFEIVEVSRKFFFEIVNRKEFGINMRML